MPIDLLLRGGGFPAPLSFFLVVDLSASGVFGSGVNSKWDAAVDIAALFGSAALQHEDRIGLLLFSDQVEHFISPQQGKEHLLTIIKSIRDFRARGKKTSLSRALNHVSRVIKDKSIICLISDFIDPQYESALRFTTQQHDVIPVVLEDKHEKTLPQAGLIALEDAETGGLCLVNTNNKDVCERFEIMILAKDLEQNRIFKSMGLSCIRVDCNGPYHDPITQYLTDKTKP